MSLRTTIKAFDGMNYQEWKTTIEKELKGKSFEDHLVWQSLDGFNMESWQCELPTDLPYLLPNSEPWKIVEPVYQSDAREANAYALSALNAGAEAVWFNKSFLGAASKVAGHGIDQTVAEVFIEGETHIDIYKPLFKDEEEIKETNDSVIIDGLRLRERGCTAISEIALLVVMGLDALRRKHNSENIIFKTGIGSGYLTEIAKVRAFRLIWQRILSQESMQPANPKIVAVNLQNTYGQTDEHTNILRATSSTMSAIIGGAQYIMIEPWNRPWNEASDFSQRISRNIQVLLKEEGRFDKVLNPADGSYFIETLTTKLAEGIWTYVTKIERMGGIVSYVKSGKFKDRITSERLSLLNAYKSKDHLLLGITSFPPEQPREEQKLNTSTYKHLPEYLYFPYELQNSLT